METTTDNSQQQALLQKHISDGRKVVMKKENELTTVRLRFNNTDTDGTRKWRLQLNGNEFQCSEVQLQCFSHTMTEDFPEIGIKHHIMCKAREIIFEKNIAKIY